MKGFGFNILNDKIGRRKGLSLKAVRAWTYWLSAKWPYASTRQTERQQRQAQDKTAMAEAMVRVRAKLAEVSPTRAHTIGHHFLRKCARTLIEQEAKR